MDGFMEGGKILKTTPEKNRRQHQKSLAAVAAKLSPVTSNTVCKIVVEDVKKRKLSARCVPHALTAEQDDKWLQVSCKEKHYCSLPPSFTCKIWHLQTDFSSLK
jgi:hypothetical protein